MLLHTTIFILSFSLVYPQLVGTNTAENHPSLDTQYCTKSGGCSTLNTKVVLDANWRWLHNQGGYQNCYTGNTWDTSLCPDPITCAKNCALEGADYEGTYGINAQGSSLNLRFVTPGQYGTNIGSRTYLLDEDGSNYRMFKLLNREFTFDVDVSNLPCGLNGALYFVEMDADGGLKYATNKAGAKYGTGYCDAQCPHDLKFINGEANVLDWKPSPNDTNAGTGRYGTCCNEMDIWEANSMATAYTPHVCTVQGQTRCSGQDCGDGDQRYNGFCDKDGCDLNSFRTGNREFFGMGKQVDTTQPFTVVTQFITNDGTDSGDLSEIRRFYVQNGRTVPNTHVNFSGVYPYDSVSDKFCTDIKNFFGDNNDFEKKGGLKNMGAALSRGMALVMSLWDDHEVWMLWLDSNYPPTTNPKKPGIARGNCDQTSGNPKIVEKQHPNSNVIYSNIRYGEIGSTTR